jgi:hypothetical protein
VPRHSDIFGNDKADELARQGSGSTFCGPDMGLPRSTSVVRQNTKEWAIEAHSRNWAEVSGCRQYEQWISQPKLSDQIFTEFV